MMQKPMTPMQVFSPEGRPQVPAKPMPQPPRRPITPPGLAKKPMAPQKPAMPGYVQQFQRGLTDPKQQNMFKQLQRNIGGDWAGMAKNIGGDPRAALAAKFKNAMSGLQQAQPRVTGGAEPMPIDAGGVMFNELEPLSILKRSQY